MGKCGTLIANGGHEDKTKDHVILSRFVALAGGKDARIAVIAAASTQNEAMKKTYEEAFAKCGVERVRTLFLDFREEAMEPRNAAEILNASGIFMTGGAQGRLMSVLGGSEVESAMHEAFCRGAVVAGTSAGGAAMSESMVTGLVGEDDLHSAKGMLGLGVGLGFLRGVVINTHFAERIRIYRLLATVAANPSALGVGIDENTAMVLQPGKSLEVIGEGAVTILDARNMTANNVNDIDREELLTVFGVQMHVVANGFKHTLEPNGGNGKGDIVSCLMRRLIGACQEGDRG